jgi:hypothetical protein
MLSRACAWFIPDLAFNEDLGLIVRDIIAKIKQVQKLSASVNPSGKA